MKTARITRRIIISLIALVVTTSTLCSGELQNTTIDITAPINTIEVYADVLTTNDIYTESTSDVWVSNSLYYTNSTTASINNNYLQDNGDGTFSRIINSSDSIVIETYSSDYELISSNTIDKELSIFGTFYSGSEYNFFVFGQENPDEDENYEVIRIVKYSKDWQRLDSASFYGYNTRTPFRVGRPRIDEHNGILYLHTSHNMFAVDGINHQANMEIYINIDDMSTMYEQYSVANVGWNGYISHSFDQYIKTDSDYVYTLDLGDAYPRSVTIVKRSLDGTFISYSNILPIYGSIGDNSTGVTLGGFEVSSNNCISVGTSINQDGSATGYNQRNVFLAVTDKSDISNSSIIWLTDFTYNSDSVYSKVTAPKLVKINDDEYIIMWNESTDSSDTSTPESHVLRVLRINGSGEILEDVNIDGATISDCDPIVLGDRLVWYSCEYKNGTTSWNKSQVGNIYHIDYTNLAQYNDSVLSYGDCNGDGKISAIDILTLKKYILGLDTNIYLESSDVNQDGIVNVLDLLMIKRYLLGLGDL